MLREVVMLRNRSRAVTSKQAIMADHTPLINQNHTTPSSSFLGSPRFFNGFLSRSLSDAAENVSPTSILENHKKSISFNPFGYDKNLPKPQIISSENKKNYEKLDSESIGLAIIDSIKDDRKMVLFGAKLKVQIPSSLTESQQSPADFGIKTRNSHNLSPLSVHGSEDSPQALNMKLSLSEMEMSEDYTCVITRGPNPKTIHIFDDCVVDSCCGVVGNENPFSKHNSSTDQPFNFLSFCYTCKDNLQEGKDIFMFRGEKAFCSNECRCKEMLSEGGKDSEMV